MLFRRTNRYGYSRYYGGGGPAWILRIIVTLAVIIGLVAGGVVWSMQKYMVYTEEGGHLELPWSKKENVDEGDDLPDPEDDLIVDLPDSSEEEDGSQSQADESAPVDESLPEVDEVTEPEDVSPEEEGSGSGEVSEAEQSGEASVEPEESTQSEPEQFAEPEQPVEQQPGLWERFTAWLKSLFAASEPAAQPEKPEQEEPSSVGDADQSGEGTAAEGDTSADAQNNDAPTVPVVRPDPLSGGLLVQHVSMGDFGSGFAKGDVQNVKGNGLMLFMKESGGRLNYPTELELAKELNVQSDANGVSGIKNTLASLKSEGLYTIAYVDCFQDAKAEEWNGDALLDRDGDPWYDSDDRCWADPASEKYQDYILGIIEELAEVGFDEIVLKNACYPVSGSTGTIREEQYQPEQFAETLNAFYGKLGAAVKDKDTLLSIVTSKKTIRDGKDAGIGHTLEGLRQLGGRLWVDVDGDQAEELNRKLEEANFPENSLGVLTGRLDSENSWCQMNID